MIPYLFRFINGINSPLIISYHHPKPGIFKKHLKWYRARYNYVSLSNVVNALSSGDFSELPPKPLVITFDDGHKGNYALLDLFKEDNVRPTIYVCSGIVATTRKYWFKTVSNPQPYKYLKNDVRIDKLKHDVGFTPKREYGDDNRQALSLEELMELSSIAEIGCHTRFHPILTTMNEDDIKEEICGAKTELELLIGRPVNHFAYPNGDYGEREINLVSKAGYVSARTINSSPLKISHHPFELPVIGISDNASVNVVSVQLSRIPTLIRNIIRHGRFSGKYNSITLP